MLTTSKDDLLAKTGQPDRRIEIWVRRSIWRSLRPMNAKIGGNKLIIVLIIVLSSHVRTRRSRRWSIGEKKSQG